MMSQKNTALFNPLEFHHLYVGILLVAVGLWLRKKNRTLAWLLLMAGSLLIADDTLEHFIFSGWSPLLELFHWLWPRTLGPIFKYFTGTEWPFGSW